MQLRASYSILSAWARGDYDRAIAMYLRKPFEPTPQMEAGIEFHKKWEQEGVTNLTLPKVFGGKKLVDPVFELKTKRERKLNDWLTIVGVLDVLHQTDGIPTGIDFKSGSTPATAYSNGFQHKFYQVLYPEMKRFEYHCFNQYTLEVTMSIVHLTDQSLQDGVEYILTHASDFRAYLENNPEILE